MNRIDIMVDLETLGTKADSTIFQISAVAFDITSGDHLNIYDRTADISKNENWEMNVSGSTIKWWLNVNKELFTKLLHQGKGSSRELLEDFHEWLSGLGRHFEIHLWSNGILFDNNMIRTQFENMGLQYPVKYKHDRDLRTLVDLTTARLGVSEKDLRGKYYGADLEAHDAFNDVTNQIRLAVACYRILTNNDSL